MSCGASTTRYFLLAEGIGGIVFLCHLFQKGGLPVEFFFRYLSSAPLFFCCFMN